MRTFVAVELSDGIRGRLGELQEALRAFDRAVRWARPEQMHLTIKFLGEVAEGQVAQVCGAVDEVARGCGGFTMTVRGTGCFPPRGPVRVLWVGVAEPTGRLEACQKGCEQAMAGLGFAPEDRAFHPHLTLGRVKVGAVGRELRERMAELGAFDAGSVGVEELVVFESQLRREGAVYRAVHRARLAGG